MKSKPMSGREILCAIFVVVFSIQAFSLRGTITDSITGHAIGGAQVSLVLANKTAVTDNEGIFLFEAVSTTSDPASVSAAPSIRGGRLSYIKTDSRESEVTILDVAGRLVGRKRVGGPSGSSITVNLRELTGADGFYFLMVDDGNTTRTFRYCSVTSSGGYYSAMASKKPLRPAGAAKGAAVRAVLDTLVVSAGGYAIKRAAIYAGEDSVSIKLSPVTGGRSRGLFLTEEHFNLVRQRSVSGKEPYASSYSLLRGRSDSHLGQNANPFISSDMKKITFGWCGDNPGPNSLKEAVKRLEKESDWMRTLALRYALTGEKKYGDKSVEILLAWAKLNTAVNIYDFNPNFSTAGLDGKTEGFCSDRPWNFALDAMWQAYGLINAADAYLLLTRNGYVLSSADNQNIREWVLKLTEAVNSSFHAWTKWADLHPNSSSYTRYRSDNHLSWCLAGLIASAAALGDAKLADYVLRGGAWTDRRRGPYKNPSPIRDVIARAIEGDAKLERGRIYEEVILRDPPVGYSLFHLWAMTIVAQVAEIHFSDNIWTYSGTNGGSIRDAYDRYTAFVLGERPSPKPDQDGTNMSGHSWRYEKALHQWENDRFRKVVAQITNRGGRYIIQSWGPIALIYGK